jgi:hypothetical protein
MKLGTCYVCEGCSCADMAMLLHVMCTPYALAGIYAYIAGLPLLLPLPIACPCLFLQCLPVQHHHHLGVPAGAAAQRTGSAARGLQPSLPLRKQCCFMAGRLRLSSSALHMSSSRYSH